MPSFAIPVDAQGPSIGRVLDIAEGVAAAVHGPKFYDRIGHTAIQLFKSPPKRPVGCLFIISPLAGLLTALFRSQSRRTPQATVRFAHREGQIVVETEGRHLMAQYLFLMAFAESLEKADLLPDSEAIIARLKAE